MALLPQLFGPTGAFSPYFLNPGNLLLALGLLVPLILLYLIRPRPVNVAVPSLMFILSDMGKSTVHRFFRTIFRDLLFILQALAVILLGLSLAKPFINVSQEALVQQSILVVDTSASTRAFDGDRFESIRSAALDRLASSNVIIIARQDPYAVQEGEEYALDAGYAKEVLQDLEPTDMDGDLPGALDLAAQLAGPQSKVTVISDFVLSRLENEDLIEAKLKVLRSKGALVETVPVTGPADNIGIIDARLNSQNATLDIKVQNFNDKPADMGIEYNGQQVQLTKTVLEAQGRPGSLLVVSIPLAHGTSELVLSPKDDFLTDNHYYISIPEQEAIKVLLLSNDPAAQQSKLVAALTAAGDQFTKVLVEHGAPPRVPDLSHDVYVIRDINPDFVLPGVLRQLREQVEEGAVLVVLAQPDLFDLDLLDLLPVARKPEAQVLDTMPKGLIINTSLGLMRGLSDIGQVRGDQLLRVNATAEGVVHAWIATNDGLEPVIAHKRIGKGVVVYYGIRDQRSIDLDPQSYAIIWGRIVDYSLPDVRLLNIPTGEVISAAGKSVNTPLGKRPSPVVATRSGFYQTGGTTLAANLYALQTVTSTSTADVQYESFVGRSANVTANGASRDEKTGENKVPRDLSTEVLLAAMALMLLELLYVKYRGDL